MKSPQMLCVVGVSVLLGVVWLLWVVPARPSSAIQIAQSFVDALRAQDLERAYQLTTHRGNTGRNLEAFRVVVHEQWPTAIPASIRFLAATPRQSYGNRLRRWLRGRAVDPPQMFLEFSVDGMPFQVREQRMSQGGWKVDFFQSHAG